MKRSELVARLPTGPQNPVTSTPARRPGSVRRTTTIDQRRGGPDGTMRVIAIGRDLLTRRDGTAEIVDQVRVDADLDGTGRITAIAVDSGDDLGALVGLHSSAGFRKAVDAALPDQAGAATVLHQLLDDFPMAALISNYGWTREQGDLFELRQEAADRLADLCAGWERGATMLDAMETTGIFPIPIGPPAPDPADPHDPLSWHAMEAMVARSVRRRRRIDLVDGDVLAMDVYFRDSHLGADGLEDVLHEYELRGTVDRESLVVLSSEATARTLPWPECPRAAASAGRAVGEPVTALRAKVRQEFSGITTCTHLNDVVRSLAGIAALAPALRQSSV